jgi:hypothetical protein
MSMVDLENRPDIEIAGQEIEDLKVPSAEV